VGSYLSSDALDPRTSLTLNAICNPKNIEKVNTAISEELALAQRWRDAGRVAAGQTGLLATAAVNRTSDSSLAKTLADCLYVDRTMAFSGDLEKRIDGLSPAAVLAAAPEASIRKSWSWSTPAISPPAVRRRK
jgi:zinc protease